jgi:predicted P-loop ATPase
MGVRLGSSSKVNNNYLATIDCDVKSRDKKHLDQMEDKLFELFGEQLSTAPMVASGRGNGSKHYYVTTRAASTPRRLAQSFDKVEVHMPSVKASKADIERLSTLKIAGGIRMRPAWEISLMGEGQQVVLPHSIHPDSGRHYIWSRPFLNKEDAPLIEFAGVSKDTNSKAVSKDTKFVPEEVELQFSNLSGRIYKLITSGEGSSDDKSADLFSACLAMAKCGFTENQILSVCTDRGNFVGDVGFAHAQTNDRGRAAEWVRKYSLHKARREVSSSAAFDAACEVQTLGEEEAQKQAEEIAAETPWQNDLDRTEKRAIRISLKNMCLILQRGVNEKIFYRNLFSMRDFYGCDTPWGGKKDDPISDSDILAIKMWLSENYAVEPPKTLLDEVVDVISNRNQIHPVRDWLKSLKHDGTPRIDTWLKVAMKAEGPEEYLRQVSRKMLLGMIARVMRPGCQMDSFPVLEGAQGIGKSSVGRILASDAWFCDTLPDIKDKDAMLNLQGAWIVEISELAVLRSAQSSEAYKAFLSRRTDRVRAPYGRRWMDVPRQSVFLGTTNADNYLRDKTGNRRFWPIIVHMCDFDWLNENRDQLFAEAYAEWINFEERLDLGEGAKEEAMIEQKKRVGDDESTFFKYEWEKFEKEQDKKPESERFDFSRFSITPLFELDGPFSRFKCEGRFLHYAAEALRECGYEKKHTKFGNMWARNESKNESEMW